MLWYQLSPIIIIVTNYVLGIVILDILKDDSFYSYKLHSRCYNFHFHSKEPKPQRRRQTCSRSDHLNIALSSLRTCILCQVRRIWTCIFLPWWQGNEWKDPTGCPSDLCLPKARCHQFSDSFQICKHQRIRSWPTYRAGPGEDTGVGLRVQGSNFFWLFCI